MIAALKAHGAERRHLPRQSAGRARQDRQQGGRRRCACSRRSGSACCRSASRARRCRRRSHCRRRPMASPPTDWRTGASNRRSRTGPAACAKTGRPAKAAARERLSDFLDGIRGYADERDRPDKPATSRLSPHLRFGEISAAEIFHAARFAADKAISGAPSRDIEKFLSELGWREFSYHLLHHFPDLATKNLQARFDAFPWRDDEAALKAWQRGRTGYPIVDAGMRELWHTGWMHNRVRMVAASFLIKHLLIDWRHRRGMVLGHAGRCRSRQQHRELAMGRGLRRRCRALFPHLQSGAAGREIRSGRRLCAALGAGACRPARQIHPQAVGRAAARSLRKPASRSARPIPRRSSITTWRASARSRRFRPCDNSR